jgi:hypothetical protein
MKPVNKYKLIGHTINTIFINPTKHWVVITLDNKIELVIITHYIKSECLFTKNRKNIDNISDITIKDIGWDNMGGFNNLFIVDDIGDVYRINCLVDVNMNIYNYTSYKKEKEDKKRRKTEKIKSIKFIFGIEDHYDVI